MKHKTLKFSLLVGAVAFCLSLLVTILIDSSQPYLASLVIAFIVFEIVFYYYHDKERGKNSL